jgi:hypothetical protein
MDSLKVLDPEGPIREADIVATKTPAEVKLNRGRLMASASQNG